MDKESKSHGDASRLGVSDHVDFDRPSPNGSERGDCATSSEIQPFPREEERETGKTLLRRVPFKIKLVGVLALALFAVVMFGVVLPLVLDSDETQYISDATLKSAVDIGNLEVVDCTYKGIAEKTSQFLWAENVDYRVKYEAHVRASYDMSAIEFNVDNDRRVVTVILPEVEIASPVIDETKFGYLPENATADVRDVLVLCKEDVANEFVDDEIRVEALESVRETVEALMSPLLDDAWSVEFEYASKSNEADESEVQNDVA